WKQGLAQIQKPIADQNRQGSSANNGQFIEMWDDPCWNDWSPPNRFSDRVRFGQFQVDLKQVTDRYPKQLALPPQFSVPASLSFPSQGSLLIHTDHAGRAQAIQLQQLVMTRLLTQLPPGRVRFTIIDPVGLG